MDFLFCRAWLFNNRDTFQVELRVRLTLLLCLVALLSFHLSGYAQTPPAFIPGSTEPGRMEKRFDPPTTPQREAPPLKKEPEQDIEPGPGPDFSLTLTGIQLDGNTVYDKTELQSLWKNFIGQEVSLVDLRTITKAITSKYRADGFILSRAVVPAQRISKGIVVLRIIEGHIHRVLIEGQIGGSASILEGYAEKLSRDRPLHAQTLERYLLLINDLPGTTAQSVLRRSPTQQGASDLVIVLEHKPFDVLGEFNNRGNSFVGPLQLLVGGQVNSPFGLYEQAGFRFATTPQSPDELKFVEGTFSQVIGSEGTKVSIVGNVSWSEPGGSLKVLGVENKSIGFDLTITHPILRSRATSLWVSGSFVFQNNSSDLFNGMTVLTRDRIRALRFSAILNKLDSLGGASQATFQVSQGLEIFDETTSGSPNLSRANGQSDFTKLNGEVIHIHPLPLGLSGLIGLAGQYAFDPLLASREFGVGGPVYVRAYDPSENLGDSGLALKTELQFGNTVNLPMLQRYQVYTYYDFGVVWNRAALPGAKSRDSLDAVGAGIRFTITPNLSGYVEIAQPLAGAVNSRGGDPNSPRGFFSIVGQY